MVARSKLSACDGASISDTTIYCNIVGALQYLTITRFNIAYVVNQSCQFTHAPTMIHMIAVKHILQYLKSTIGYKI